MKGKENVIVNCKGERYVRYGEYAIGVVDEVEEGGDVGEGFSVVCEGE